MSMGDVKNAFHSLVTPRWLSEYFGFEEPFLASDFGLEGTVLDGVVLGPNDIIYCLCRSLSMGCKWSLYFCQLCRAPSVIGRQIA